MLLLWGEEEQAHIQQAPQTWSLAHAHRRFQLTPLLTHFCSQLCAQRVKHLLPSPLLPHSHRLRMPRCEQKDEADSSDIPQRAPVTARQLAVPRGPVHMSISITEGRLNASLRLANPDKVRQQLGQHPACTSPSAAARTHATFSCSGAVPWVWAARGPLRKCPCGARQASGPPKGHARWMLCGRLRPVHVGGVLTWQGQAETAQKLITMTCQGALLQCMR